MHPIEEKLPLLPAQPGVYIMKGAQGVVLYVGKAKNLKARLKAYVGPNAEASPKTAFLVPKVRELDTILTQTEKEAFLLENTLIKKYRPRYNIELKDDKTYLHILLDRNHPYPRFVPVRRPGRPKPGQMLFGPYSSASAMRDTLRQIQRIYLLRTCKDREFATRKRPCLRGQMGRCVCACVNQISPERYAEMVDQAVLILQGRSRELVRRLEAQMEQASEEMRFEEAAQIRDRIRSIRVTLEQQRVVSESGEDRDVVGETETGDLVAVVVLQVRDGNLQGRRGFTLSGRVLPLPELLGSFLQQYYTRPDSIVPPEILLPFEPEDEETLEEVLREIRSGPCSLKVPRRGEKKQLLDLAKLNAESFLAEQVQEDTFRVAALSEIVKKAGLARPPARIECFDMSNLGGTLAVGSRVVFRDGLPWKDGYRRYKIRTASGADDYAMMYEVLRRRFEKGTDEEERPDLLLVDGGRGQLGVALRVLKDLGIEDVPAISIAKVQRDQKPRAIPDAKRAPTATRAAEQEPGGEPGPERDEIGAVGMPALESDASDLSTVCLPEAVPEDDTAKGVGRSEPVPATGDRKVARPEVVSAEGDWGLLADRIFRPGRVNPLALSARSPGLRLLQQIRDETHRFAVTYQRKLRSRELSRSELDEVPGIGPRRKRALFKALGDLDGIRNASVEELAAAPGMNEKVARLLWSHLHAQVAV